MTYRDPDGWRSPARAPQHAAPSGLAIASRRSARLASSRRPPGSAGQFGTHTHQALRLFVTVGSWAAGLCLVIGLIVLVATATEPTSQSSALRAAAQESALPGTAQPPAPSQEPAAAATAVSGDAGNELRPAPAGSAVVLAAFAGRGNRETKHFHVSAGSRWGLRWSYQCGAGLAARQFIAGAGAAADHPAAGAIVDQTAVAGHGISWLPPGGLSHYLVVISTCSWTIKVVQS